MGFSPELCSSSVLHFSSLNKWFPKGHMQDPGLRFSVVSESECTSTGTCTSTCGGIWGPRRRFHGGAWGPAAKTFFNTCVVLAGDDRDIDLYHWSSERFSAAWRTTISVLAAKGRARVGVAGAATDWPKRIRDLQFLDHEGDPTTI